MIPQPYRINFDTLNQAFSAGAACLLECNRRGPDYELVPFAQLFDDNPYELLAPLGEMPDQSTVV
jgi:hypothetical protein